MDKEELCRVQIDLTRSQKARLNYYATMVDKTQGGVVTDALEDYFKKNAKLCVPSDT
jgi:hypothetical protein